MILHCLREGAVFLRDFEGNMRNELNKDFFASLICADRHEREIHHPSREGPPGKV